MSRRVARLVGIAAVGLTLGAIVAFPVLLDAVPPERRPPEGGGSYLFAAIVIFALVGALILWHRPSHPLGWVYAATGVLLALSGPLTTYATITEPRATHEPGIASIAAAIAWITGLLLPLTYGLLLFPDGHLPSPRWRPIAWAVPVVFVLMTIGALGGPAAVAGSLGTVALALASFASLFRRFRRARRIERQQLKWAISAIGLLVAGAVSGFLSSLVGINEWWLVVPLFLALTLYPLSVAVAILRYRLYDIDLLINRTLVYGVTTAAIATTFYVGIVALQGLLRTVTSGSELPVAASTLVSFALFQPIRRRIQEAVDRRFDRSRYDAARTVDEFAGTLRDEVDLDALKLELLVAVSRTMSPAHSSLWLRERAP